MVFLAIVPLAFAAFGNYVVPLMIGAPDMAFPRVNMASYQSYVWAASSCSSAFSFPAARRRPAGPLIRRWRRPSPTNGQTFWLDRHGVPDHLLAARRGEFHCHHHSTCARPA